MLLPTGLTISSLVSRLVSLGRIASPAMRPGSGSYMMGNITKGIEILFCAVNKNPGEYRTALFQLPESMQKLFLTVTDSKLFCLRVLLANVWMQPHHGWKDWFMCWA